LLGYLTAVAALGILLVSACAGFGATILRLALRPQYQQYSHLLVWMTVAASIGYVAAALSGILASLKCFVPQAYLMAAALAVTFISCWYLIPRYGLLGAAWATMAFMAFQAAGAVALLHWWRSQPMAYRVAPERVAEGITV
jgi:O-antigen/teichoic acid export membrane protein